MKRSGRTWKEQFPGERLLESSWEGFITNTRVKGDIIMNWNQCQSHFMLEGCTRGFKKKKHEGQMEWLGQHGVWFLFNYPLEILVELNVFKGEWGDSSNYEENSILYALWVLILSFSLALSVVCVHVQAHVICVWRNMHAIVHVWRSENNIRCMSLTSALRWGIFFSLLSPLE